MKHILFKYLNNATSPITVDVIGAGGNGSEIMQNLATISYALQQLGGTGLHVKLWDDTVIRPSNKGRQRFFETDEGRHKATVIIERINRAYGFTWESIPKRWNLEEYSDRRSQRPNIMISCVDILEPRKQIQKLMEYGRRSYKAVSEKENYGSPKSLFYWMDLGNGKSTGQIALSSICGELLTIFDIHPKMKTKEEDIDEKSCSFAQSIASQGLFINRGVALAASEMLWTLLSTGAIESNVTYLNLGSMKMNAMPIRPKNLEVDLLTN